MAQFVDLPIELQIEIFSILSVKHAVNILSINKSTHDQLSSSETFWKRQINNYSKAIGYNSTPEELFNIANVKAQFLELIDRKRKQTATLQMEVMQLTYMLEELQMVQIEMNFARINEISDQIVDTHTTTGLESMKEQIETVKEQMLALEEKLKTVKID